MSDRTDILEAALRYAAAGVLLVPVCRPMLDMPCRCDEATRAKYAKAHVVPGLHIAGTCVKGLCADPGKHPLTPKGARLADVATSDPAVIQRWFAGNRTVNIGALVGDFHVLDVDRRMPVEIADALPAKAYPVARTGRKGGGAHHFLSPLPRDLLPPTKLDFGEYWSGNQQVVLPPSLHASGTHYAWESGDSPLGGPLPGKGLLKALRKHPYSSDAVARADMAAPAPELFERVRAFLTAGGYPHTVRDGEHLMARCPSHAPMSDPAVHSTTSFDARVEDETLLLFCRGGCAYPDLLKTLGLGGVRAAIYDADSFLASIPEADTELGPLLDDIAAMIGGYIDFGERGHYRDLLPLWIAHTYVLPEVEVSPRLRIVSAIPRSGKTRLCELLTLLAHRPVMSSSASASAAATLADMGRTLVLDEVDQWFNPERHAELASVINSGYVASGSYNRTQMVADDDGNKTRESEDLSTFAAVVLAGIGLRKLPPATVDRCISVALTRKASGGRRYRGRTVAAEARPLSDRLAAWAHRKRDLVGAQAAASESVVDAYASPCLPFR